MASVTFRSGNEIDQRDAGVRILQKYWKEFAPRDAREWSQRIANSGNHIVAAYVDNVIAGILEAIRINTGGDPYRVPATFQELTADGTWSTHTNSGDTVVLVDLTIASEYHGAGLFEALAHYARKTFESPSGLILTYSPLFFSDRRYWVVQRHERLGARLITELRKARSGLTMMVGGEGVSAEDVGITAYSI
jgi:hypothetical protein